MAATTTTTTEKGAAAGSNNGIMDIERTISNSFANVDGAVAAPPSESLRRPVTDEEKQHVDDSSDATAVEDGSAGSPAPDGGMQAWLVVLGAWRRHLSAVLRRGPPSQLLAQPNLVDPRAANLLHVLHGALYRRAL
ncbi:hypothetical protein NLG97_g10171 [Lecanicillium saksenae]|uniref:Uncharacterized protein n=1 Tax=Lecanicillium saksenae TaxID=468837 RepID=A0ACC1QEG8_9HYPO|nr:hypothetical protein NLG97_g10171 [Lecanicillium saksenae]